MMTSTLPKQIRQMKQGDRWRKIPIRVDHPDEPGLGYPYLIDGDDTDAVPAGGYSHQIAQEGDCTTAFYRVGTGPPPYGIELPGVHGILNCGQYSGGPQQSPPDPVGWCWWYQLRFPIDVPIGTQLTGAAILDLHLYSNAYIGPCVCTWRLLAGGGSTGSFQTEEDCHYDRSADLQTPYYQYALSWIDLSPGQFAPDPIPYTLTNLVQAFIDGPTYEPYDAITSPNTGWLGLGIRFWPGGGFMSRLAVGFRDAFGPEWKAAAPLLRFPYGEEVPGQAGTRFCVATEAGRIHQIRMEKLGVE